MMPQAIATQTLLGAFDTIAQADRAIRGLLEAGFTKEELAVVCPAKFKDHFSPEVPQSEVPTADPEDAIAKGGALGATLGGLAWAATVLTGGAAGVMAGAVLIGGAAIAGGFSNLIISKGYEHEGDDAVKQAILRGQIVVGVEVHGDNGSDRLAEAQHILDEAEAIPLIPAI